jgi:hypothetical protein
MERENVKLIVRTVLAMLTKIAGRTRTQADDLLASMLRANEERLVDAVLKVSEGGGGAPTDAQIVEALATVGIKV